jgi:uncharacterized protein with GYD domain
MARYILLINATRQGVENRKTSPAHIEEHKKNLKAAGIDVRASYHTLGPYDGFMIVEAANGAAVGKAVYRIEAAGNIRIEMRRLFTEDEYKEMVAALP